MVVWFSFFVLFIWFFEIEFWRLSWNSICRTDWPQTHKVLPVFTSQVLGFAITTWQHFHTKLVILIFLHLSSSLNHGYHSVLQQPLIKVNTQIMSFIVAFSCKYAIILCPLPSLINLVLHSMAHFCLTYSLQSVFVLHVLYYPL